MIVLLPVSRYRVSYEVASGRPYSFFERFILEAIIEGHSSLEALESTFRIHRRALIEGVVTLIHAGWVAMDRNTHAMVPTASGKQAIGKSDALPKNIVVTALKDYIVGERVQGQVARGTEVRFSPRSEVSDLLHTAAALRPNDLPHPLEPGVLLPFLRVGEGEWVRACGPIDIVRDGADFVVVDVDTSSETVTGIPSRWIPLLRDELVERARAKERQLAELGTEVAPHAALLRLVRRDATAAASVVDDNEWLLEPGTDTLLVGSAQHSDLLGYWLDNARSYVGIASESLNISAVSRILDAIRASLNRGVLIDVAWGAEPEDDRRDSHHRALELLNALQAEFGRASGHGRLTVSSRGNGSRANILLGDVSDTLEAVIGSHAWLGSDAVPQHLDVSVLMREREPVARIGHLFADLAAIDEAFSTGPGQTRFGHALTELHRLAAETAVRQQAELKAGLPPDTVQTRSAPEETLPGKLRVRLAVGREHAAIIQELASKARQRIVLTSHRWGSGAYAAFRPLKAALERGRRVDVRYSAIAETDGEYKELSTGLEKLGGVVRQMPDLRANLALVDDDTAVVTSYEWLHPDPARVRATTAATDVGLVMQGGGIALRLLERVGISAIVATPPTAEYLTSFRVKGLRSVSTATWAIEGSTPLPGWHVIVGDNGSGKTSILRGLALVLVGSQDTQALRQDWSAWVRGGETVAEVEAVVSRHSADGPDEPLSLRLTIETTAEGHALRTSPENGCPVLSVGYGPFRRFTGGDPDYEKQLAIFPRVARHLSLFDERVALTESLAWLRELRFKELENDREAALLLDRLTKLVNESQLFPSGVRLHRVSSDAVLFQDDEGNEYPIEELSDGYRSVLSLTFDIVRQLAIAFGPARVFDPERTDLVTAPAIVLIDEVDAHLHPGWQRTIGQWFHRHFPRIQFIVTTHSPLVCQAAESGSVYRLPDPMDPSDQGGMLDGVALARLVYGNVLEAYASGAFGDRITRSDASKALLQRLADLNRKELSSILTEVEQEEQERLRTVLPLAANNTQNEDDFL